MSKWKHMRESLQRAAANLETISDEIDRLEVELDELRRIRLVLEELPKSGLPLSRKGGSVHAGKPRDMLQAEMEASRKAVLSAVATLGPATFAQIAARANVDKGRVRRILERSDWFESEADGWHLTAAGQQAWNDLRETAAEEACL